MPTIDLSVLAGMLANLGVSILSYVGIAAILYSIGKILIRTISWTLDNMIISFIGKFYGYFEQILGGTIFSDVVVRDMMNRVYLIIGVILLFRLGMLLVQYIINPAQVMEEKGGVNSLVKRSIIGVCLIIFIPTIFNVANDLQAAILKDQIIEKIIMDEQTLKAVQEKSNKYGMGKVIGMTIFQGFWNVDKNQIADKNIIRAYEEAEKKYDPNLVTDAGYDILTESGGKYAFDYFPILSTAVLGYVLYLIIKYCIDMVLKSFKLLILQVIAPITIVEYIVNGDRNEVFQKWRRAVVANYAMLFVRVFTIWFVAFVTILMNPAVTGTSKTLLNTQDYLLKAIIVLALLAFMMDLPKMLSEIFGLDLEQDTSVKNVLGKAIGVGVGGLAIGGAVAGFGAKTAHGFSGTTKAGIGNFAKNKGKNGFTQGMLNPKGSLGAMIGSTKLGSKASGLLSKVGASNVGQLVSEVGKSVKDAHLDKKLVKGAGAVGAAILNSNKATQAVYSGYSGVDKAIKGVDDKEEAKALKAEERAYRQHQIEVTDEINTNTHVIVGQQAVANVKLDNLVDNSEQTLTQTVNIDQKLGNVSNKVEAIAKNTETTAQQTVNIDQKLGAVSGNVEAIAQNTETAAQHTVNVDQKLGKISGKIDTITDNTEISAEQSIDINQKVGNISGDISNISDNTELIGNATLNIEHSVKDDGKGSLNS